MAFNWLSLLIAAAKLLLCFQPPFICAVILIAALQLAALPLKQENGLLKEEEGIGGRSGRDKI